MKAALRRALRERRDELSDRPLRSQRGLDALDEELGSIERLGSFAAIGSEADARQARAHWTAFPRIEGQDIVFRWCDPNALRPSGAWSIPEPPASAPLATGLDLVLVPGLAFDRTGARLGYGKGFYDRFLRRCRSSTEAPRFVGFGFEVQLVDEPLPQHDGDERLDGFLCEAGLLWFPA